MSQSVWGPPVWTLFHTLIEKLKEEHYSFLGPQLFNFIKRISSVLPCPECSQHANHFLSMVNVNLLKTKIDLRNIIYIFHNVVNIKKGKQLYNVDELVKYKEKNLINVYNHFVSVYNTKGNMNLIADSFQRQLLLKDFKPWMMSNITKFDL
jgi:hypothetical protein